MNTHHKIKDVNFIQNFLLITIDGKHYKIDLRKYSKKLATTDISIKNNYIVSSSGYGIHWPDIDEDLSINGFLKNKESIIIHKKEKVFS